MHKKQQIAAFLKEMNTASTKTAEELQSYIWGLCNRKTFFRANGTCAAI